MAGSAGRGAVARYASVAPGRGAGRREALDLGLSFVMGGPMDPHLTVPTTPPPAAPAFLDANGWEDGEILPLAGDASFRRYFRVVAPGRSAVLMDAPPPNEDPRPFLAVSEHLRAIGFRAPETLA